MRRLFVLFLGGTMTLLNQSCQKNALDKAETSPTETATVKAVVNAAGACLSAPFVDTWQTGSPIMYVTHGTSYVKYDLISLASMGSNQLSYGFPGIPFTTFDASFVDTWQNPGSPQLYVFSGNQYARYDLKTNAYMGVNTIVNGFPGVPFTSIDAAFVDTWQIPGSPQLYIFSGTQYALYDLKTNTYKGSNSIVSGFAGVPFTTFDAVYVDTWQIPGSPQLYIFKGNQYARYDLKTNTYKGMNSTAAGFPGLPICQ
ncbi:hypothetical protein HHL17_24400 [Chitinophaga sp. G-6-1-13]|uniref:Hemopexin n=1 Tax=Chitinophaga fulva TaxID=2728842 RepID=A0A848GS76_9BACT|nr:hypothetical protein [Chitinophaga fulva]NML40361.1 hypothetical protein [Chitinophaga fulva]